MDKSLKKEIIDGIGRDSLKSLRLEDVNELILFIRYCIDNDDGSIIQLVKAHKVLVDKKEELLREGFKKGLYPSIVDLFDPNNQVHLGLIPSCGYLLDSAVEWIDFHQFFLKENNNIYFPNRWNFFILQKVIDCAKEQAKSK